MLIGLLTLLGGLFVLQEDQSRQIQEAVQKLRSSAIEEREEASRWLVAIGSPALVELEKASRDPDPEIRSRASAAIQDIQRYIRISPIRPAQGPVTVDLRDTPLAEAFSRVLGPFGLLHAAEAVPKRLSDRKVTLLLRNAGFWEALDGLAEAAHLNLSPVYQDGMLTFKSQEGTRFQLHELMPVLGRLFGWIGPGKNQGDFRVTVALAAVPKHVLTLGRLDDVILKTQDGKTLPYVIWRESSWDERRIDDGIPCPPIWAGNLEASDLKNIRNLSITAVLTLRRPHDLQRTAIDLADPRLPKELGVEGDRITLKNRSQERGRDCFDFDYEGGSTTLEPTIFFWAEDRTGSWLSDLGKISLRRHAKGSITTFVSRAGTVPATLVLATVIGEDESGPLSF